jgi:hypothetical protein
MICSDAQSGTEAVVRPLRCKTKHVGPERLAGAPILAIRN